jgi:hypothetical protein
LPNSCFTDSFQIIVEDSSKTYEPGYSEKFSLNVLMITSPRAGQIFTIGQTVDVTWRSVPSLISAMLLKVSTDGGKNFKYILLNSLPASTTSFNWVIGSEADSSNSQVSFPSNNCIIMIRDYGLDSKRDLSGVFSVR